MRDMEKISQNGEGIVATMYHHPSSLLAFRFPQAALINKTHKSQSEKSYASNANTTSTLEPWWSFLAQYCTKVLLAEYWVNKVKDGPTRKRERKQRGELNLMEKVILNNCRSTKTVPHIYKSR